LSRDDGHRDRCNKAASGAQIDPMRAKKFPSARQRVDRATPG
jgi:hypothetical protein